MKITSVPTARKSFRLGNVMLRRDQDLSEYPKAVIKDLASRGFVNMPNAGAEENAGANQAPKSKAKPAATRREKDAE